MRVRAVLKSIPPRCPLRRGRPGRSPLTVAAVALIALSMGACDRGTPPPTNPLDESLVTATAATGPTGPAVFPPSPAGTSASGGTSTPAPGGGPTVTPNPATEAAHERAAARAIDAIAGWLGVASTEFTIGRVETVAWMDACLGVARPEIACAQVITPGERVTVQHRSGEVYEVHLGPRDAAAWQPRYQATRTIAGVDLAAGVVTLQPVSGGDEMGTRHRVVPGSMVLGLKDLKLGDRVEIAVAPWPGRDAGVGAIVWLVRARP